MKSRYLLVASLLLLILSGICFAQYEWQTPVWICGGDTPDFDIDHKNGHLHIISMRSGVLYTETDQYGNILVQEYVPGAGSDNGGWQFGATIAVDQDGYPHVCFRDWRDTGDPEDRYFNLYYTRKKEEGWSTPLLISSYVWRGYVARMAVDGQNRVHIVRGSAEVGEIIGGPASYYRVVGGLIELIRDDLTSYRADDRLEITATSEGYVHIVLGSPDQTQGPVSYYRSQDGGATIQYVGDIHSTLCWGRNGCPDVFADNAGNLHFSYGTQYDGSVYNEPSIRYVLYNGNVELRNVAVTQAGALSSWKEGDGWGLSSVAASSDGQYVVVAYVHRDGGTLYTTLSSDNGYTWSSPALLDYEVGGDDGRNFHLIRAYNNHFYLVYPTPWGIRLRILRDVGDFSPVASAGGPYYGQEGESILLDMSVSSDEGQNAGIVEYAWDWEGDGIFDFTTDSSMINYQVLDDFNEDIVLRVTDRAGNTDYDTTSMHITNVAPLIEVCEDMVCDEGDTLDFSCDFQDPGTLDTHTIIWTFGDGSSGEGYDIQHIFGDDSVYSVVVTVTDDDIGVGKDSLIVTVNNVPPTADAGGPYSGTIDELILFTGEAYDPGPLDSLRYFWDLDGDNFYESQGLEVSRSFANLGNYIVRFKVEDDDGGVGLDIAEVHITNEAPVIALIPDQSILEGESFTPVLLDDYVEDPDQSDDQLSWTHAGIKDLLVTLEDRILTIAVPDIEWSGQETLLLTVADPVGLEDSTRVIFTVSPVNDPPQLGDVPDYSFNEDDTLQIPLSGLWALVTDVDDDSAEHWFELRGSTVISGVMDTVHQQFQIFAPPDWYGSERQVFVVSDTAGAEDTDSSLITVNSVPDPPGPFYLVSPLNAVFPQWPDSIEFQWHASIDPDPGDVVYYTWTLSGQDGGSGSQVRNVTVWDDTTTIFLPDQDLTDGIYFWWVVAYDPADSSSESSNNGILFVGQTEVDIQDEIVPQNYKLLRNYPNPFNPETKITFHMPVAGRVHLVILNPLGQQVRVLERGVRQAGVHTVIWDGRDRTGQRVPSGIYFCCMEAGNHIFFQKMVLVQ